jgi:hypothetical protein
MCVVGDANVVRGRARVKILAHALQRGGVEFKNHSSENVRLSDIFPDPEIRPVIGQNIYCPSFYILCTFSTRSPPAPEGTWIV